MSRLNDLLRELRGREPALARDLEREVSALADRRAFGLNFERHVPEAVELPGRKIRKGDKVRILPPRGQTSKKVDDKLWRVVGVDRAKAKAALEALAPPDSESDAPNELLKLEITSAQLDDLIVVAEFRDPIYPGLVSTGKVERGGDKPFHSVINAENFHALETLLFTHRGKVDCIYIDPPYNTGAKDWKYNNHYVEAEDLYRHSKWLAFMERRLKIAKELLNPSASALIVTIDEKEYLRLGLLLEQTFPEGKVQMISSVINPKGVVRANEFTRTNEFIFFVLLGEQKISPEITSDKEKEVRWASLRRFEISSRRHGPTKRLEQFYPVYIDEKNGTIKKIGTPLGLDESRHKVKEIDGCVTVFPLKPDGTEMVWGLSAETCRKYLERGFVKVVRAKKAKGADAFTIYYLTSGQIEDLEKGALTITGKDPDGSVAVAFTEGKFSLPTTQWERESHNAQAHGSGLLKALLPDRSFPFPKSLYAVEDALSLVVKAKNDALILDFFSGSGTTAHAVMRLNQRDNGKRQCICVTNNEVGVNEQKDLRNKKLRPGDEEWEKWGICNYITKPRVQAAITGNSPDGKKIVGDYKFTNEFPIAEGLKENAEFFTLTYEAPLRVASNREFNKIAPLLWMRAGAQGRRIDDISKGWEVAEGYGVLADLDRTDKFLKAVKSNEKVRVAYIVTDEERLFEAVAQRLPERVEPVRLYEAYLRNFEIESGRSAL